MIGRCASWTVTIHVQVKSCQLDLLSFPQHFFTLAMSEKNHNTLVLLELAKDIDLGKHAQWVSTLQQVRSGGGYAIVWGQVLSTPRQAIVFIGQSCAGTNRISA